jgi:hypothetical protein
MAMKRHFYLTVFVTALLAALVACAQSGSSNGGSQNATVSALGVLLTQTAVSAEANAQAQAQATPTVAAADAAVTVQAQATEQVLAAGETRVAADSQTALDAAATATRIAPIQAELASYGVDPAAGQLAWIHPPVTIQTEGYLQYDYANMFAATVAQDFVMSADITWNTRFGTTGCGFVLRTDGREDEQFNQYLVIATRGAQGRVGFIIMQNGTVKDDEITDIYANGIDPLFDWQNDTTNRLTVVARGNTFTIFTNGTRIGEVTPSVQYERGFVAFVALNESGDTTCHYDNAWLWLLN